MRWREYILAIDWILASAAFLLVAIGLAMFLSIASNTNIVSPFFSRQIIATSLGIGLAVIISRTPYHSLRIYIPGLYVIGLALLGLVSVSGRIIRGTISRLEFMGFQLQPSEIMKIILIVSLAWLFARHKYPSPRFSIFSLILTAIPVALVLAEPDVGVAALMVATWAGIIFYVGTPWKTLASFMLVGIVIAAGAWYGVLAPYQKNRLISFIDPGSDPLGSGYNVRQSIVALGSGGLFGRGLGHGPQSQLKFLPERHTDFIFASIGEELGFIGIAVVLLLYAVLLARILVIGGGTSDPFGQVICAGAFILLLASFVINTGMNMGVLPVTGIPLPLVSYGGSNLLATWVLLGLVQSVHVHSGFARKAPLEITHF